MRQLQLLINGSNLKKSPKQDMNAVEDFLEIVTIAHVIAAAMKSFKMTSSSLHGLEQVNEAVEGEKQNVILGSIRSMLKEQLQLPEVSTSQPIARSDDKVTIYAREVLSLGMLHAEFKDTVKECDGPHVINVAIFTSNLLSSRDPTTLYKHSLCLQSVLIYCHPVCNSS